jgi:hypothetical protein
MPDEPVGPTKKGSLTGAGIALVVIGLLILVPSGLCAGAFGIIAVINNNWNDGLQMLTEAISFGFIPIVLGSVLLWAGLQLRKKK